MPAAELAVILGDAGTYLLVLGVLAFTFAAVVVSTGRLIGDRGARSTVSAVLRTLAAVAAAALPVRANAP